MGELIPLLIIGVLALADTGAITVLVWMEMQYWHMTRSNACIGGLRVIQAPFVVRTEPVRYLAVGTAHVPGYGLRDREEYYDDRVPWPSSEGRYASPPESGRARW